MRLPSLWTQDETGLLKWVQETIVFFSQLDSLEGESAEEPVTSESAGMTRVWLGSFVPVGWVRMDGTQIFITEAPDLFEVIGYTYNPTPLANMFQLPPAPTALAAGIWIIKR